MQAPENAFGEMRKGNAGVRGAIVPEPSRDFPGPSRDFPPVSPWTH